MLRARRRLSRLSLAGTLQRSALLAGVLSSSAALAQTHDERFPFLAVRTAMAVETAAPAPAPSVAVAAAVIPLPVPSPLRAGRALAAVPIPRVAPRAPAAPMVATKPSAEPERTTPVRVAYAAQPADGDSPFSWLMRRTTSEPTVEAASRHPYVDFVPRPPAPIPDRTAVPQLEPRYHVRRVPISPADLVVMIENKAIKHGVPLALAHAVVRVESNFDPRLTGPGTTIGLMQIKHPTAQAMGFTGTAQDLLEPETNLEWGMRYLARAHRLAKGDICGTVMRYQGGLQATQMSAAAIPYCGRVKTLMAMR
jgi:soluble lytic murein transglycosylase-like protein